MRRLSGRRTLSGRRKGLVMLGGWTATVDYWGGEQAGQTGGEIISRAVTDYSVDSRGLLTVSCATDETWGNSTMMSRITTLVDECQSAGYFPPGRVNLFGNSMGSLCVLKWALTYPTRVASIGISLPAPDVQSLYDRDPAGVGIAASISAAYGGRPADSDNPADRADELIGIPIKMWYSTNDPLTIASDSVSFGEAVGAEMVSLGAIGHTWGDYSIFNGSAVAEFAKAYGS